MMTFENSTQRRAGSQGARESQMLSFDMVGLSETDLEKIVADRCSRYGRIVNVRVVRQPGAMRSAVALVRTATAVTLDELVERFGATKSHSTAIIRLEQTERDAPDHSGRVAAGE
jgi:hypothetical protein